MGQPVLITDREGDTLRIEAVTDTLFLDGGTDGDEDPIWALDRAGVEKLRDACTAFLTGEHRPAEESSFPFVQQPPPTGCSRGPNGHHSWMHGSPPTCFFCSETWTEEGAES